MASVCECPWDSDCIGACVMRDRIARSIPKRGNICPNCKCPVEIGQECIDHAGLTEYYGFFNRFHRQCFELMELFGEEVCGGGWHYPFDLVEAAGHAAANGDEEFWKSWLLLYEETWVWTPEPPDPEPFVPPILTPAAIQVKSFSEIKVNGLFDVRIGIEEWGGFYEW